MLNARMPTKLALRVSVLFRTLLRECSSSVSQTSEVYILDEEISHKRFLFKKEEKGKAVTETVIPVKGRRLS